jgi:hypothetical protein
VTPSPRRAAVAAFGDADAGALVPVLKNRMPPGHPNGVR